MLGCDFPHPRACHRPQRFRLPCSDHASRWTGSSGHLFLLAFRSPAPSFWERRLGNPRSRKISAAQSRQLHCRRSFAFARWVFPRHLSLSRWRSGRDCADRVPDRAAPRSNFTASLAHSMKRPATGLKVRTTDTWRRSAGRRWRMEGVSRVARCAALPRPGPTRRRCSWA
jgi:hypothetical protein